MIDRLFNWTHKELVFIAYKWVLKNRSCGVAFRELVSASSECPDVIGFGSWGQSTLIEVKVSRSDFLADKKKPFRKEPKLGVGKHRFYFCPTGMIKKEELPEGWGLVYVDQMGKPKTAFDPYKNDYVKKVLGHPGFVERNILAEHTIMYSALRRLHIKGHINCIYDKQYNYDHKEL